MHSRGAAFHPCLAEKRIKPKYERYDEIHEVHHRLIRWSALGYIFSPG